MYSWAIDRECGRPTATSAQFSPAYINNPSTFSCSSSPFYVYMCVICLRTSLLDCLKFYFKNWWTDAINWIWNFFLLLKQTSYRGRKALNLGGVVSPRAKQPKGQNSPAPAAVPTQSPNSTTTTTTTASVQNQQASQPNITHIAQSPQLDNSQHNGHQNGINRTPTMKDHGSIVSSTNFSNFNTNNNNLNFQTFHRQPPMTFYPTYHTTPTTTDQTWQNQFMNQIPQNASVATVAPTMGHIELQQVCVSYSKESLCDKNE